MLRIMRVGLVGTLAACVWAFAASGAAGESDKANPIKGTNGCGDIQVRPEVVVFACGDYGLRAESLNWRDWGNRKTKAEGRLAARDCIPSCVEGGIDYFPATLVFRKIKTVTTCGGRSIRMYTRYKMDVDGGQPAGFGRYDKGRLKLYC